MEYTKAHKLYLTHRPTDIPETVSVTSREALWLMQGMGDIPTNSTITQKMNLIDHALKSIFKRTGKYYGEEEFDIEKLVEYQPIKKWEDPNGYGY